MDTKKIIKKKSSTLSDGKVTGKLTSLGKAVVNYAKDSKNEKKLRAFYNEFLNSKIYLPVITKKSKVNFITARIKKDIEYLVVFDNKKRCGDWIKMMYQDKEKDLETAGVITKNCGYDFINETILPKLDISLDIGKEKGIVMTYKEIQDIKKHTEKNTKK